MGPFGSNYDFGDSPLYMDDVAPTPPTAVCNDGTTLPNETALDIIKRALRLLGVLATGEEPDAHLVSDCLRVLNWMVDQWSNEKLMLYYYKNEGFPVIQAGVGNYTIGPDPSQAINTSLPVRIQTAYVRDTDIQIDYHLDIIPNESYEQIILKSLATTYPLFLNFVRTYPYGLIRLWPLPAKSFELHISQWQQLIKFPTAQDIVCLPPGYKQALGYNLAVEMAGEFGQEAGPSLVRNAEKTKDALKMANYEPILMKTDLALISPRPFNIFEGY